MLNTLDRKLIEWSIAAKWKWNSFIKDEDGAVDIVAIVVLMGIVILVAIVFRTQLSELVENLFNAIGTNANKVINNQDI